MIPCYNQKTMYLHAEMLQEEITENALNFVGKIKIKGVLVPNLAHSLI